MNVRNAGVEEAIETFNQPNHLDLELIGPRDRAVDRGV